ncbi:MAG: hypothetical protein RL083_1394, partial [Pseudomonadota bacterium]
YGNAHLVAMSGIEEADFSAAAQTLMADA